MPPTLLRRTPDSSGHTYNTIEQAASPSWEIIEGKENIVYPKMGTNEAAHRGTFWVELL
jgi:hypothetical protein